MRSHSSGSTGFGKGMPITTTHLQHADCALSRTLRCLAAWAAHRMRQTNRGRKCNLQAIRYCSAPPAKAIAKIDALRHLAAHHTEQQSPAECAAAAGVCALLSNSAAVVPASAVAYHNTGSCHQQRSGATAMVCISWHLPSVTAGEGSSPEHRLDFHC